MIRIYRSWWFFIFRVLCFYINEFMFLFVIKENGVVVEHGGGGWDDYGCRKDGGGWG